MAGWGRGATSSPQNKSGDKSGSGKAGAAAVNKLAKQYDKPVKWRLQGDPERRIEAWYRPITRLNFSQSPVHLFASPSVQLLPSSYFLDLFER